MKATYQNNFKFLKNHLEINKGKFPSIDIKSHHYQNIPHDFARYCFGAWSDEYFSKLNHINLYLIVDFVQLVNVPYVLIRDGLFTIVDFFNRFPTPKGLKTIFIINEKFKDYIPSSWKNSVLIFKFEINHSFYETKTFNDILIVKGHIMTGAFEEDYFLKTINKIKNDKRIKKIYLCIAPRQNNFIFNEWQGDIEFSHISNNLLKNIYQEITPNFEIEFINWKAFFSLQNLHKYEFWDANKKDFLYLDDQTDFFLYRKGAKPYFLEKNKQDSVDDLIIKLSHAHSIKILKLDCLKKSDKLEVLEETLKLLEIKKGEKLNVSAFQAIQKICEL